MSETKSLLDGMPILRPMSPEQLPALEEAAKADSHTVALATHVVTKHGEIIGYVSLNAIPTLHLWMDSKKAQPRDSMAVLNCVENLARAQGGTVLFCPISKVSPFHAVAEKLGYNFVFESDMFIRRL